LAVLRLITVSYLVGRLHRQVGRLLALEDSQFAVGNTIPDSLMLNTMPIAVKDQIGLLKDFKFAKLTGGQYFDSTANRKIVDIITKQDAGQ